MTNKNPYEKDETLDIPDFLEDTSDDPSVDMSIFKMSDKELYDDVEDGENNDEEYIEKPKRNNGGSNTFLVIVSIILFLSTLIAAFVAYTKVNDYKEINSLYLDTQVKNEELKAEITKKDEEIAKLNGLINNGGNKQDDNTNEPTSKDTYVVSDGPISFRSEPSRDKENLIEYNGEEKAYNGEEFVALEVVKGTDDAEYTYIKIAEDVYLCLGTPGEVWAKKKN